MVAEGLPGMRLGVDAMGYVTSDSIVPVAQVWESFRWLVFWEIEPPVREVSGASRAAR